MTGRTILVTLGDPAGIGPEVIEKALVSSELPTDFSFQVIGDPACGTPGRPDERSGQEAYRALMEAGERLRNDPNVAAVVTGPVSKFQLTQAGFPFPGQTEYFSELLDCKSFAMCLTGRRLTVGLATIHVPLAQVVPLLSTKSIVHVGRLLAGFVSRGSTGIPRIAVAGLNPHSGEGGKFGNEEQTVIQPAIDQLNRLGIGTFSGPAVPDAVFRDAAQGNFDAVIAMYHDQGLIPVKLLDFDNAVNVTLGLPKPRTSPDHGTAFSIAGKGLARHDSMLRAMIVAAELARN